MLDYKYKPVRVPAAVLSPKALHDLSSSSALSLEEERHLQRKVQELVWFFQNKKPSSSSAGATCHHKHALSPSARSLGQTSSVSSLDDLVAKKANLKRTIKQMAAGARSNEHFHQALSSRQAAKRSVGSLTNTAQIATSGVLHSHRAPARPVADASITKQKLATTLSAASTGPYSTVSRHPAASKHSVASRVQDLAADAKKRKSVVKPRKPGISEPTQVRTEETPKKVKKSTKNAPDSYKSTPTPLFLKKKSSLAETRRPTTLHLKRKSHQPNLTLDEPLDSATRETRCTPMRPRAKKQLQVGVRSRSGSVKSQNSPKRSSVLHFALFKDHSHIKYGSMPLSSESIHYPKRAFKQFMQAMSNTNNNAPAAEIEHELIQGKPVQGVHTARKSAAKGKSLSGGGGGGGGKPQLIPSFLQEQKSDSARRDEKEYFNPHPRSPYKKEIDKAFLATRQVEQAPENTEQTVLKRAVKPLAVKEAHHESKILASRNYMPPSSPQQKMAVDARGQLGLTPATAVDEASSYEQQQQLQMSLDETPPPLPLPVKMFSDESLTTPEKRPRPFSYFVNKSGAALKALRDSETTKELRASAQEVAVKFNPRQDTPKASLSTEEQSYGPDDLFGKFRLMSRGTASPQKFFEDSPVQAARYQKKPQEPFESDFWDKPTAPARRVQRISSDVECANTSREVEDRSPITNERTDSFNSYERGLRRYCEDFPGLTAEFGPPKQQGSRGAAEETSLVDKWLQPGRQVVEEEKEQELSSVKELHTFRGHYKSRSSIDRDSDTTEHIPKLGSPPSSFKEVRLKVLCSLGNFALYNTLREEAVKLIQRQVRRWLGRERAKERLGELKVILKVAKKNNVEVKKGSGWEHLPYKTEGCQTEKMAEVELFKWLKGDGKKEHESERWRRSACYGMALAVLSVRRLKADQ